MHDIFPKCCSLTFRFSDDHLPAWAFECPFGNIDYNALLSIYQLLAQRPESIIATAIAAGCVHDIDSYSRLSIRQKEVIDSFSDACSRAGYSKRVIVLFGIFGFVSELMANRHPGSFIRLLRKLVSMEELEAPSHMLGQIKLPEFSESKSGGLADPLNSVESMFDLLDRASSEIYSSKKEFIGFHTPNPYILLGREKNGQTLAIYAYCGGRSKTGHPCETFPLILGKNWTCASCNKLICHECGYCSHSCSNRS